MIKQVKIPFERAIPFINHHAFISRYRGKFESIYCRYPASKMDEQAGGQDVDSTCLWWSYGNYCKPEKIKRFQPNLISLNAKGKV